MSADFWIAIATSVIAIATGFAAGAAWWAARATRRTTEASLFAQLMSEYSSPEMSKALTYLADLANSWRRDPTGRSFEQLVDSWASINAQNESDVHTNNARRRVSHFYRKTTRIIEEKLISGGLRKELAQLSGRELMHDVVIPMERALARKLGTDHHEDLGYIDRFQRTFPKRHGRQISSAKRSRLTFPSSCKAER